MDYKPADILHFTEYVFNDTGTTARHFGLAIIPSHLTKFKESQLCAVVTSQEPRWMWAVHTLDHNDYTCFNRPSYIRLKDLDYVPFHGLNKHVQQPVGRLTDADGRKAFKQLKKVLYSPNSPLDKYLSGVIIREWKKIYPPAPMVQ